MADVDLSIVVAVYDMAREAPRTLRSLTREYQQEIDGLSYEVLVVDNGSPIPLGAELVESFGPEFRYHYVDDALPSPCRAINEAMAMTSGETVALLIDGARITTPGILRYALEALSLDPGGAVGTLSWHLGPDLQWKAVEEYGYSREHEDHLFDLIEWPTNGYRLFEVASLAGSSKTGYWFMPSESNCVVMGRVLWDQLRGLDQRFELPGGGMVNLDFWRRVTEESSRITLLLGEGTFHQMHGGAATGGEGSRLKFDEMSAEYRKIVGEDFTKPQTPLHFVGELQPEALDWMRISATISMRRRLRLRVLSPGKDKPRNPAALPGAAASPEEFSKLLHSDIVPERDDLEPG